MEERKHMQGGAQAFCFCKIPKWEDVETSIPMCDEEQNFTNQAESEATIKTVQKGY